jgi:hypothetical protein
MLSDSWKCLWLGVDQYRYWNSHADIERPCNYITFDQKQTPWLGDTWWLGAHLGGTPTWIRSSVLSTNTIGCLLVFFHVLHYLLVSSLVLVLLCVHEPWVWQLGLHVRVCLPMGLNSTSKDLYLSVLFARTCLAWWPYGLLVSVLLSSL